MYQRDIVISELETRANAKRFEKWEAPVMPIDQKNASPNKNGRRGGANTALNQYGNKPSQGSVKSVEFAGSNSRVPRRDPDELYRIRLDSIDPQQMNLEEMFQDSLPPET